MAWDQRLDAIHVTRENKADSKWVLLDAKYFNEQEAGGRQHVYFTVKDALGNTLPNVTCVLDWSGRDETLPAKNQPMTDSGGNANVPIWGSTPGWQPQNGPGPYFAYIEDLGKSDVVRGMGLPMNAHVYYHLTFGQRPSGESHPTETLEQAAIAKALELKRQGKWMPINDKAALYQFAQQNKLGYPQTDEFQFSVQTDTYVGQVYNLGIVYTKKGEWGMHQIRWAKKPPE